VFEDVAVVDVAAGDVEPDGDLDDVAGVDSDDVVPAVNFAGIESPRQVLGVGCQRRRGRAGLGVIEVGAVRVGDDEAGAGRVCPRTTSPTERRTG
jgi:hypothetical protein